MKRKYNRSVKRRWDRNRLGVEFGGTVWILKGQATRDLFNKKLQWSFLFTSLFKLNLELLTSICRMNCRFHYRPSIRALIRQHSFLVLKRRLHLCNRWWATGCTYVCDLFRYCSSYKSHFTVIQKGPTHSHPDYLYTQVQD